MSSSIISCASISFLIYSFVFLSSLKILADRLNASILVALIVVMQINTIHIPNCAKLLWDCYSVYIYCTDVAAGGWGGATDWIFLL